jgi:hypothetical protein
VTAIQPVLRLSQLREPEAEAIHMMREVAAEFERPVLLFSGGKDSRIGHSRAPCTSGPVCPSSRCSSTRRSRSASGATRRASTPAPARATCPGSPASTASTRRPRTPELVVRPPTEAVADAVQRLLARLDEALGAAG